MKNVEDEAHKNSNTYKRKYKLINTIMEEYIKQTIYKSESKIKLEDT